MWRFTMPIVDVKIVRGTLSVEQKQQMVEKVGEAVLAVEGEAMRPYLMIGITELEPPLVVAGKTVLPRGRT